LFAGDTQTIVEMIDSDSGLQLSQVGMFAKKPHTEVLEIVISHNSTMISKTVRETNFRGKYDAAIIAIHRNGEKISGKIGDVKLSAGDVLLLLVGDDFNNLSSETLDFYMISKIKDFRKLKLYKLVVLLGGTALAIQNNHIHHGVIENIGGRAHQIHRILLKTVYVTIAAILNLDTDSGIIGKQVRGRTLPGITGMIPGIGHATGLVPGSRDITCTIAGNIGEERCQRGLA
jgi:di/tricarboxylate transporter